MTITVEDNFYFTGRGVVVTGKSDGLIQTGDTYALQDATEFKVRGIERFAIMLGQPPKEGEQIGILLGDIDRDLVPAGTVLYRIFGNCSLENPAQVIQYLEQAREALSQAHQAAGEREGDRTDLIGPIRDAIFGLGSTVEALIGLIADDS